MLRKVFLAALATTAVSAVALPGLAVADPVLGTPPPCVKVSDLVGADFEVKQCGVSDVDQFRAGLPGNGNAHCGPSSLYNVLHYWGHEKKAPVGWLTTKVGELNPKDPADYTVVGNSIWRIGVDAKFNNGTNMGNLRTAFTIATQPARNAGWSTATDWASTNTTDDWSGTLAMRLNQGPVQLVYGRYAGGPRAGSLERTGGHIVTVVSAKGSFDGNTVQLKLADPGRALDHGDGDYLYNQSAYESLDVTLERKTIVEHIAAKDDANTPADESLLPGTYRNVVRWELTGPRYVSTKTRQMVEGFNWFVMSPPVG